MIQMRVGFNGIYADGVMGGAFQNSYTDHVTSDTSQAYKPGVDVVYLRHLGNCERDA